MKDEGRCRGVAATIRFSIFANIKNWRSHSEHIPSSFIYCIYIMYIQSVRVGFLGARVRAVIGLHHTGQINFRIQLRGG